MAGYIDDIAEASDSDNITDESLGDENEIDDLFDEHNAIGSPSSELAARASTDEYMNMRDELNGKTLGRRRLSTQATRNRGKSPVRVRPRSRSRSRSPTPWARGSARYRSRTIPPTTSGFNRATSFQIVSATGNNDLRDSTKFFSKHSPEQHVCS